MDGYHWDIIMDQYPIWLCDHNVIKQWSNVDLEGFGRVLMSSHDRQVTWNLESWSYGVAVASVECHSSSEDPASGIRAKPLSLKWSGPGRMRSPLGCCLAPPEQSSGLSRSPAGAATLCSSAPAAPPSSQAWSVHLVIVADQRKFVDRNFHWFSLTWRERMDPPLSPPLSHSPTLPLSLSGSAVSMRLSSLAYILLSKKWNQLKRAPKPLEVTRSTPHKSGGNGKGSANHEEKNQGPSPTMMPQSLWKYCGDHIIKSVLNWLCKPHRTSNPRNSKFKSFQENFVLEQGDHMANAMMRLGLSMDIRCMLYTPYIPSWGSLWEPQLHCLWVCFSIVCFSSNIPNKETNIKNWNDILSNTHHIQLHSFWRLPPSKKSSPTSVNKGHWMDVLSYYPW